MNNHRLLVLAGLAFLFLAALGDSFYIVPQMKQAILLQFRDIVRVDTEAGIHFKIPVIQSVAFFEKRVLAVDAPSQEIMLAEQKPLEVDAFARYHITDPLLFFQRLSDERVSADRLSSILNTTIRGVLGKVNLVTLLSTERVGVMEKIRDILNTEVADLGVKIIDVRIRRADLPEKTSGAVFSRMRSEREQEAADLRAKGKQEALERTAEADREAVVILAEAERDSEKLKGEGDRKALEIIAKATKQDPQFFAFWRSLIAYKTALKSENTTYLLSPDSGFFKHFESMPGK